MRGLTLILPAHNEGESIRQTLLEIDSVVETEIPVTIYVSEDGSSDDTRSEVLEAAKLTSKCSVVLSPPAERLGYSRGVLRGIQDCRTDFIGFMDADGQCDPQDISELLARIQSGKIVVGYRNPRRDSKLRIVYSNAFGIAYRIFGGPKRKDPSSPFIFCCHSDIADLASIKPHLSFGFWWEFQIRTNKMGLSVIELPVNHRIRAAGETQVYSVRRIPKIVVSHLIGLYKLRQELKS